MFFGGTIEHRGTPEFREHSRNQSTQSLRFTLPTTDIARHRRGLQRTLPTIQLTLPTTDNVAHKFTGKIPLFQPQYYAPFEDCVDKSGCVHYCPKSLAGQRRGQIVFVAIATAVPQSQLC
jgi:hypothetical protein